MSELKSTGLLGSGDRLLVDFSTGFFIPIPFVGTLYVFPANVDAR
jgi:hypothetical protein